MTHADFRARIYGQYVHARETALAPASIAGLSSRAPYLQRVIREHFPPDREARILDLGCGHGSLVWFARQAGYRYAEGVDRSPEQVAEAQRLGIDGVREGDLMETLAALPEASQHVIIAFDVIEHFTRDELLPFIDAVHRALAPGGRWLIHTPNAESPFFGRIRYGDITHEQAFTVTSLNQLLRASRFADVRCFEDTPVVHGAASAVRWLVWKLVRAMLRAYLIAETGSPGSGVLSQNMLAVAVKDGASPAPRDG
ncbi:MAG TPA: class I SAM-dependent methyltransferase [Gemmatimonadaceae bacterium]|nr:class I SAM-dependent methyltransferase [Gemmatimonadaceae bacterium]